VENLTHSLVGAALSKAGLEKKTVLATPALVVAANLPDIDIFASAIGRNYLDFHRGITHSLPGVAALSAALAAAFWAGSRLAARAPGKRVRFLPMLGVCLAGVLSNPLLDLLNDYGSRPWLPFSDRWYYGDLISIADPWIWIIFGAALFVLPCSNLGGIALAAVCFTMGGVVLLAGGGGLAITWVIVLGAALAMSRLLRLRGHNPARVALAVFLVYLGGLYLARGRVAAVARETAPRLIGEPVEQIDVLPGRPGSASRWTVVAQTRRTYYIAQSGPAGWLENPPSFETYEKNLGRPEYRESLAQSQMAAMARFARFPCVTVERSGDSCTVILSDLRYARRNRDGWGAAKAVVPCGAAP
jgi:inner membrane protein